MSDIPYTPLAEPTAGIRSRLDRLRQQLATWLWIEGVGRVLWLALALFVADLALDWLFRLDRAQRVVLLGIMLVTIGWAIRRWLVRPLSVAISDEGLALQVERASPRLQGGLITALQLSRTAETEARGMSSTLVRHSVLSGARLAQEVSFGDILDNRRGGQNVKLLTLAGLLWLGLALALPFTAPLQIWLSRNVFLGNATWPQMTYLVIERLGANRSVVFPRGEDWTQVVSVSEESRVVPSVITLDFRPSRSRTSLAMNRTSERQFGAKFSAVIEPFEFRARGGDCVTEWTRVELVDQPALAELKLTVTPPRYTGNKSYELEPGRGPYSVLPGSSLRVDGKANKPLVRAALLIEGEPLVSPKDLDSFPPTKSQVRLRLIADRQSKLGEEIPADMLLAGKYRFELADAFGLVNRPQAAFSLRKRIDREPRVRARLVGVSVMVVSQARIPLNGHIEDDFGITDVKVSYRWRGNDTTGSTRQGLLAFEQLRDLLSPAQVGQFSNLLDMYFDDFIDLAPLAIPTGTSLSLRLEATDNNDVTGPRIGLSPEFLLRIVTEEELRADLLQREKQQRLEFERLLKNQEDLVTDSRALAAALISEEREPLVQLVRRQKQIGQDTIAVANRLAAIVSEISNNRLEAANARWQTRLTQEVIVPLAALADNEMPQATTALDQAKRQTDSATDRKAALSRAIALEQETATQMQAILDRMVKAEGFQEAVNLLYEIQKAQSEVNDQTNKARQERIKRILDSSQPEKLPEK